MFDIDSRLVFSEQDLPDEDIFDILMIIEYDYFLTYLMRAYPDLLLLKRDIPNRNKYIEIINRKDYKMKPYERDYMYSKKINKMYSKTGQDVIKEENIFQLKHLYNFVKSLYIYISIHFKEK